MAVLVYVAETGKLSNNNKIMWTYFENENMRESQKRF